MAPSNETDMTNAIKIANAETRNGHSGFATLTVSGFALLASLYSMWETTLKQPQISLYVSENIQYTRDPYGPSEVLAIPLTITNGGARDSAVLSMHLIVRSKATGRPEAFKSAYLADAQYFGGRDDVAQRIKRPKIPFAPISVAARGAFSGTVLFYRSAGGDKNIIEASSELEMTLMLVVPPASNQIDRLLTELPQPVTIKAEVPSFYPGALLSGDNAPLKVSVL